MIKVLLLISITSFAHDHRYRAPIDKTLQVFTIESQIGKSYNCGKIRLKILSEHIVSMKKIEEIDTEYFKYISSDKNGNLYTAFLQGHQTKTSTIRKKKKLNLKLVLKSGLMSIIWDKETIMCSLLKP